MARNGPDVYARIIVIEMALMRLCAKVFMSGINEDPNDAAHRMADEILAGVTQMRADAMNTANPREFAAALEKLPEVSRGFADELRAFVAQEVEDAPKV
jgi:hypothetical protein